MPANPVRLRVGLATAVVVLVAATWALYSPFNPFAAQSLREGDVHREFGYITLKDGIKLAYVVYRPSEGGSYPTLLEFSPYEADSRAFDPVREYLERGYAYAGVNIRGSSCSKGEFSLFDAQSGDDGAEVVEWLGTRPWSSGAVGMIGNSYPGHTQIWVAAKNPRHLKAIAAGATTASGYREAWRPAGMFNYSFIGAWAFSSTRGRDAERRATEWGDTECDASRAWTGPAGTFKEVSDHPLLDEWWRERDLETYAGKIEVPTLLTAAWQDHQTQVNGPIRLFNMVKTPHKKLLLQPGGHGGYNRPIARAEWLRWMDHWLKGEANGVETEPPVTAFWEVHDVDGAPKANWTTTHASWPPPKAAPLNYFLTADGRLSPDRPGASPDNGARNYVYPLGTELVADNSQFAMSPHQRGTLTYRTAPMTEDTTLMGFSQLTFYLSSEQKDTDVMVVLHDIDANGNTLYLQRDFLRASLRAIDTAKSSPEESVRAFNKVEELVPGEVYELKVSIPPVGHVIRRGHSLELAIMAPSHIAQPNWGFMIVDQSGLNTVYHSARYPSSLSLSVLPGVGAQAPAPTCGVMDRQPCRPGPDQPSPVLTTVAR